MNFLILLVMVVQGLPALEGFQKCYGDLGCYKPDDYYDATYRPIMTTPESRESVNTKFLLYTRSNQAADSVQYLQPGNASSLQASHFRSSRFTKIIIHGYTNSAAENWIQDIKDTLLSMGDFNVMSVDWKQGANGLYDKATANVWLVGGELALLIQFLCVEGNASLSDFHLVGHSLGAHVAGYAGQRLQRLGRITALDPAAPFFEGTPASMRLDVSDADFVDVIHTDSIRVLGLTQFESGFGMREAVGHVDFYPNGGNDQPGCNSVMVDQLWTALTGNLTYVNCDHRRSVLLLKDSLTSQCSMVGFPCDNYHDFQAGRCTRCMAEGCGVLGLEADKARPPANLLNVKYFLNTGPNQPYCKRHFTLAATLSRDSTRESGTIEIAVISGVTYKRVTLSPEELDAGATYGSYLESVPGDGVEFDHVLVWYTFQPSWWNPLTWFGSHRITLNKIEMFVLEFQKSLFFCGNDIFLVDRSAPTRLNVTSTC